jgi:GH25 family lysozyme M1 (1,4-beta-N-acetylmuramidase)
VLLIDLYQQYNPVTDWSALSGAVAGAYLKYSDGSTGAHVPADAYAAGCRSHGIPYGGYHYAEASPDPVAQAQVFLAQYQRLGGTLAPALDLESGAIPVAQRGSFARQFLEQVHASYPVVVLYASASWLASLSPDTWPYPWDRTWCAAYGINDGGRHAITGYSGRIDLHQYTSVGSIPGVSGHADLDYTDNLSALLLTGTTATTPENEMAAIPYSYQATGVADAAGNVPEQCHTMAVPVGSVSTVVAAAWLSFKSAVGPAKSVRLMAIASGTAPDQRYLVDKTWTNVPCDAQRPYIPAPSGCDQFTAFVQCEHPYTLCVETQAK